MEALSQPSSSSTPTPAEPFRVDRCSDIDVAPMSARPSTESGPRRGQPQPRPVVNVLALQRRWRPAAGRIFDVAWSPVAAERLVTAGEDQGWVWKLDDAGDPSPVVKLAVSGGRPAGGVTRCTWHPAGAHVLTGSAAGLVTVHCAESGGVLATLRASSDESEVYGLTFLSNEGLLGVAASDAVQQWDLHHVRQTAETTLEPHEAGIAYGGLARNPERRAFVFGLASRGRVLAAALSDGTCRLLDAQSLKPLCVLDEHARRGAAVFACALSPTSTHLATAAADGAVLLWDLRAVRRGPLTEIRGHTMAVHGVAFAPAGTFGSRPENGELLVTGGADCTLRLAETRTAECVCKLRMSGPVLCASYLSISADHLASGGGSGACASDNSLSIWSNARSAALEAKPQLPTASPPPPTTTTTSASSPPGCSSGTPDHPPGHPPPAAGPPPGAVADADCRSPPPATPPVPPPAE